MSLKIITFTPIQSKSKNTQTYTKDNIAKNFFLNFLEVEKIREQA